MQRIFWPGGSRSGSAEGGGGANGVTHRTVYVGDELGTKDSLEEEPYRPGPPSTGPGVQHNEVVTSQYTVQNFIFKNLWKQFHRPANIYFLFISGLQCIKAVSITNGVPTTLLPLLFVLFVTALKDAIEDFNRHRADSVENNRTTHCLSTQARLYTKDPEDIRWHDVKVSDLLQVRNRELIPADMVILASSETNGLSYVMTANLDGETNLKAKEVKKEFLNMPEDVKLRAKIVCDLPNNKLEHFEGTYILEEGEKISLTARNVLLRGCILRNTDWIIGAVIYTGRETKIQMNSAETPFKVGSLRSFTDRMTFLVFCLQITCCMIGGIVGSIYVASRSGRNMWYIWTGDDMEPPDAGYSGFLQFWTYIIIFTNFIPISLLVTLDMVKFFQASMMMLDLNMYHETKDNDGSIVEIPMQVRSSDLNEELGVIEHVFSDKTGTLTCNVMEFCKCSVGGISYGLGTTQIGRAWRERNGLPIIEPPPRDPSEPRTPYVNIIDPHLYAVMKDQNNANHKKCREFFLHLALNHDVMPEGDIEEKLIYSASSPDESALVYAARHFGFFFCKREPGKVTIRVDGVKTEMIVLHVLEFTSDRKKSSVIVRRDNGTIVLFCKGADNIIKSRLSTVRNSPELLRKMEEHLVEYVNDGLRTLVLAKAEIPVDEYKRWAVRYHEAETSTDEREKKRYAMMDEVERDLEVMGVTAIEDKLQDGVPETLKGLREAGVKVWMLTGDKVDTAINIGYSCSLLSTDMTLLRVCGEDGDMELDVEHVPVKSAVETRMKLMLAQAQQDTAPQALIVDTYALAAILKYELQGIMVQLCRLCKSVVCARVSPKQKAKVVEMIKTADPRVQTLSIGDGANDVPMIQTAHIGVGIHGLEGQQAVNNSDYAIGQFRFLRELLLVHGRWNYRRTSRVVIYIFYKNALLVLPQFFFGMFSMYSGQNFYFDGFYQLYNVIFTAFPIIALGVFDQDVKKDVARGTPTLYRDGLQRLFLNVHIFWGWMLEGIIHAVLVTFLPLYSFGSFQLMDNGQVVGLWDYGTMVFFCVISVASLRLSMEVLDWQWTIILLLVSSLLVWWLSWAVYSSWVSAAPLVFGSISRLAGSSRFWLTWMLTTFACFITGFAAESYAVLFEPRRSQIVKERQLGWHTSNNSSSTMQSHNGVAVELVENKKGTGGIIATTAAAAAGGGIGIEFTSKASRTADSIGSGNHADLL